MSNRPQRRPRSYFRRLLRIRRLPPIRRLRVAAHLTLAFGLAFALGTSACKDRDKGSDDGDKDGDRPAKDEPAPSSPGDSLGMMSALMSAQSNQPGPYDEPTEGSAYASGAPHAAVVEIAGQVSELNAFSIFGGFEGTELRTLVDKLNETAGEPEVTSIILRFGDLDIGPAVAEEFHAELLALRAAHPDKPLACHAEAVSTYTYWVMTACARIALTPGGDLAIPGIAAVPMHLKGLLDRLGLRADFLHIGDYKGAAEPLTLDAPSAQSKETTAMILDEAFAGLVSAIAKGRSLKADEVSALIDRAMFKADEAAAAKLVDEVKTFAAYRGDSWRLVKLAAEGNPTQKIFDLLGLRPTPRPTGARVALVYAVGNVVDGEGSGGRQDIASRKLVAALEAIGADDDVKAVVIRVSSPGGSALASEVIWSAIAELKKTRPVVVSMGDVAASGGYYISAPATRIFANKNTLTGSIGVVGGKIATAGGLSKLGIKAFPTGRGKHALLFASPEPWTAAERDVVRASMKAVYDQFAGRVRQGRGEIDDALMQGRVWTGSKALEHKLVDEIGGLRAALAYAREEGGLGEDAELEVYPPEATLKDMIATLGVSSGLSIEAPIATAIARLALELDLDPPLLRAVTSALAAVAAFRTQPIQAAMILPTVLR